MRLLAESFLTWRRHRSAVLAPHGVTLKQVHVLRYLSAVETLAPSDVAEMLFCDRPTASVVLKNLEKKGLITRQRDRRDRRRIVVRLAPKGAQKLQRMAESGVFRRPAFDPLGCFDSEELGQLERLLSKLRAHLEHAQREPAYRRENP